MHRKRRIWPVVRLVALTAIGLAFLATSAAPGGTSTMTASVEPPANRRPPRIDGIAQVGQVLQASRGTWRRDRGAVFSYQWRTCDAPGTTCADIAGATDRIYPVRPANAGQRLLVAVEATTSAGSTTASSGLTPTVRDAPEGAPRATARPTVTGKLAPGSVLTANGGTWQGTGPIRFQYRWRRCSAEGGACEELDRTGQTYTVAPRDAGHTLRVLVRAENSISRSAALSDSTGLVPGSTPPVTAPKNTSPPRISGTASQGKTLTASSGTWSGTTPMSFAFQWRRCARDGDDCSAIPNASQATYTLVAADVGRTLRVRVSARNEFGTSSVVSDRTAVVAGANAPVNTAPPTISGTAREGNVLTASPGEWRGTQPIDFRYQWLRCGAGGGGCAQLANATGKSLSLTSAEVGRTVRVRITASNGGGASVILSGPSPIIASKGTAPASTAPPVLSGSAVQGSRLNLSTGAWGGTKPLTFSYRWMRCDTNASRCGAIGGATGSTYVLTRADVGHRLVGIVTARNSAGSSSASSNATPVVVGAPVNTSPPTIAGTTVEGQVLTASPGAWTGVGPITFGYQWTRCNAEGVFSSCVPIVVTSQPVYTLRTADVGRRVFVQVSGRNAYGTSFVNSVLTGVIVAAPVGTVTARAGRSVVVFGARVVVTGRAVGARPGDPVTILERPLGKGVRVRVNAAVVGPAGTWSFVARPTIRTTYRAQVRGRTSGVVTVRVRTRMQLRRVRPGTASLRVVAARSLAGRTAFLQRWNARRGRWVTVRRVRLRPVRTGQPGAPVAGARFRTRTPRGTLLRVVLPNRQAGPGYLTSISNRIRS
jgi:hypothetical protein